MNRAFPASLVVFALLLAACGSGAATTTTTVASTTTETAADTSTTDSGVSPVTSDLATECEEPAQEFEALCEAYRIILANYVDPVSDADLAAGALAGIEAFETDSADLPAGDPVACAAPSDEFGPVCQAFTDQYSDGVGSASDLAEAALTGMIHLGLDDPYSIYLNPQALENFRIDTGGSVEGIGALVRGEEDGTDEVCQVLSDTCHMVIVQPLGGSPALAAGIEAGDFVVEVDGDPVEGSTMDEVVSIVRGPAGTDVNLGVIRQGERLDFTITRAAITVPNVEWNMMEPDIGYLRLALFASNADETLHEALADLLGQGAQTIILDLRSNPGGSLQTAVNVASEFLDDGLVLITQAPGEDLEYDVKPGGLATDTDIELLVLVDRASASASEVVAGVLQERGRATLIGEPTFGKNTVQQQFDLSNGGAVKVTIARWVTPLGDDFGQDGIQPGIEIEFDPDATEDPWLTKALELAGG